jgi:hypothetical protein
MRKREKFLVAVVGSMVLALCSWALAQPPDFPLWCHGKPGMASTSGRNLIIDFVPASGAASRELRPGQCSWLDRALRPGEPTRVVDERPSAGEARNIAMHINGGEVWTFWVFNAGQFLRASADFHGMQTHKPTQIDSP